MKKIFSLFCTVMMTVLVFGQSYGILVNGHTYFAGESAGENEGFTQYLSHVQLQSGDYCQLYDASNNAAWAVTLNSYSVEGFALNNDRYEVTVDGCYDFYIKLKYGQDELYIGNGSNCGEGEEIPTGGEPEEFVGFDARTVNLGEQIAAGLAKNLVNVTFEETSEGKYSVNLVEGGVEGSFSFGGVIFAYTNSNAGSTAYKTYGTYIQPNGKDREIRIPLNAGEKANVILTEACAGVLVNGVSTDLVSGDNILTATEDGLVLKTASTKPKIQAVLPVVVPVESTTVYYVNETAWENVNAFVWPAEGDAYKAWPGEAMNKEAEQINGFDVYSYTFPASYVNIIFNNGNGGDGNQTADLVWDATKPYFYGGVWYAKADIPTGGEPEEFVGFDARTINLGEQIAAGLAKNLVNVTFVETSEGKYSVNLVEGGVEGSFSFGGVVFAYKNSSAGATAFKTYGLYIQPNGKDREVRIPLNAGEKANVILYEACEDVLVNGVSTNLAVGDNILTATEDGLVLKSASTKPKIQAVLPVTETAKFYITGDAALLGEELAWNPAAIKVTEDSYTFENLAAGDYKLKVTVNGTWEEGMVKGFSDLTTVADGLTADADGNICFTLAEAGNVSVHYDGEYFFLNGNFYVVPVVSGDYYMKNGWDGGEWTWKAMTLDEGTYFLANVVVSGDGVNLNNAATDEGASWITWAEIETYDMSYEAATISALDTVVFMFDPEAVNQYTGANGLSAIILGKYVAPVDPEAAKFYITGDAALLGEELAWNPAAIKVTEDSYTFENLAAGDYKLKVTVNGTWEEGMVKGFSDLTTVADGLTADADGNICFTLAEAGNVSVHYDGEYFFLNGNFYVEPVVSGDYYMKNGWDGGEWTWKAMTLDEGTYFLANVVVSGDGVNLNNAATDEGASWITWAEIETYDMSYEAATISALDTVVFMFDPEAVNQYTGANGLSAIILGKYVAPVDPEAAKFYITGDAALLGEELAWNPAAIKVTEDSYTFENLAAGDYKLKVTVNGTWEDGMVKGFSDLTTVADGLTADADGNICFTLAEAGNVSVHYDGEYFFLNGNFYVEPVVSGDYYMKNGWDGGEWTWKAMTLDEGTYFLANVVVSGDGVNLNNAATDEGASWITWAEIETYDMSYEAATISALDTVVFMFDPEAVNQYTGANGLSAIILGKYVAPVDPQQYEYGLLVDGTFVPATKNTEYVGEGEEWVVTTNLVAGNKFQNYENTTSAGWLVPFDPNEGNYTNFDIEDNFYVVKESGNYTFYIKLIFENDNMWVVMNEATAISNTAADAEAVKVLHNGMLLIRKGNKTYTIMGQAVK